MINIGFLIGTIIAFIVFCILSACIIFCDDIDKYSAGHGVLTFVILILCMLCITSIKKNLYFDKYTMKMENIENYKVDTTFITTNNVTDTLYTIYYNGHKEKD